MDSFKLEDMGVVIGFILIYAIFYQYVSAGGMPHMIELLNGHDALSNAVNATMSSVPASKSPAKSIVYGPTPKRSTGSSAYEPKTYSVRMDTNGFYPNITAINVTDTVIWTNMEYKRTRVIFISKDDLFEKKYMIDGSRFEYRFTSRGNFSFVLAQDITNIEYQNAKGNVIVN